MMYIETSAKTREGIRQAFEEVVQKILDSPALVEATVVVPPALRMHSGPAH